MMSRIEDQSKDNSLEWKKILFPADICWSENKEFFNLNFARPSGEFERRSSTLKISNLDIIFESIPKQSPQTPCRIPKQSP